MEYIIHILIVLLLYIMLSQSLLLSAGYTGLLSLAQAGFYGIGAYTTAILSTSFDSPFLLNIIIAIILSGIIAFIVSLVALRTVDDYFIIITLGIQVIAFSIMNNWVNVTNGPMGITAIPNPKILGLTISSKYSFFLITLIATIFFFFIIRNLTKSPWGRILVAISEDEIFTKSLGKKVSTIKITSFIISAVIASVPGVFYAHYISFIDPSSFTITESIFILSIVIIGGMKNMWGVTIAATILIILPELLRLIGMPNNLAANMRQIIYGLALVFMMLKYNKGFIERDHTEKQTK